MLREFLCLKAGVLLQLCLNEAILMKAYFSTFNVFNRNQLKANPEKTHTAGLQWK